MRAQDLFERGSPAPVAPPPPKPAPNRPAPPLRRPAPGPVRRPDPARPGKIHPDERPDIKPKMCEQRALELVDALLEVKMFSNPMKAYTFASGGDQRCSKCGRPLHNGKCTGCSPRGTSQSTRTPPPTI